MAQETDGIKNNHSECKEVIKGCNNEPWYKFSAEKGKFMLGLMISITVFGVYMKRPSIKLNMDSLGTGAYVRCAGSLNGNDIDIGSCRTYFEGYLPVRIDKTNNLPRIVPVEMIANTYLLTNKVLREKGQEVLKPLVELTNGKIAIDEDGSVLAEMTTDATSNALLKNTAIASGKSVSVKTDS
ncbi:hypothetical protein [Photobacterium damselae]|uniref:Uncharacterized protein n=1 Tax=Photobacterium damselae subsp. damselae TaxID=85581 RepID=A0AAD3ZVB0_PHODD|nr:hypothetical protein [Photobacterium damselae]KAB1179953.1 hypothetical protein F6450_12270 [Photobacterium damselae subsp. damselae]